MEQVLVKIVWLAVAFTITAGIWVSPIVCAFVLEYVVRRNRELVWFEKYGDDYANYSLVDANENRLVEFRGRPETRPARIAVVDSKGAGAIHIHIVPFITDDGRRHIVISVSTLRLRGVKDAVMPFVWTDQPPTWMRPGVNSIVDKIGVWSTRGVIERVLREYDT